MVAIEINNNTVCNCSLVDNYDDGIKIIIGWAEDILNRELTIKETYLLNLHGEYYGEDNVENPWFVSVNDI